MDLLLLWPFVLAAGVIGLVAGIALAFLPGVSPAGALVLGIGILGPLVVGFGPQSFLVFIVACAYGTLYGRALAAINQHALDAKNLGPFPRSERPILVGTLLAGIVAAVAAAVFISAERAALTPRLPPIPYSTLLALWPPEASALLAFLLLGGAAFGRGSAASALAMVVLGILLAVVGADLETGVPRLTFGMAELDDGFDLVAVALGLFVVANAIDDLVQAMFPRDRTPAPAAFG